MKGEKTMTTETREEMHETYLPLRKIVDLTDIPENSCKRYMLEHEEFINFHKEHNRFRVHISAVETLKTIRRLYAEGYKKEAVDEYLRGSGAPVTITANTEEDARQLLNINEELEKITKAFHVVAEQLVEQKEQLDEQQQINEEILKKLERSDKKNTDMGEGIAELKQLLNRKESDEVARLRDKLEAKQKELEKVKEEKKGRFLGLFKK